MEGCGSRLVTNSTLLEAEDRLGAAARSSSRLSSSLLSSSCLAWLPALSLPLLVEELSELLLLLPAAALWFGTALSALILLSFASTAASSSSSSHSTSIRTSEGFRGSLFAVAKEERISPPAEEGGLAKDVLGPEEVSRVSLLVTGVAT